jgi:hypothetical protein
MLPLTGTRHPQTAVSKATTLFDHRTASASGSELRSFLACSLASSGPLLGQLGGWVSSIGPGSGPLVAVSLSLSCPAVSSLHDG